MLRAFIAVILLLSTALRPAWGADIVALEVTEDDGRFSVSFDAVIDAPLENTMSLMLSPPHWPQLSRIITEARALEESPDGPSKVSVTFRDCILFFCATVRKVEMVTITPGGHIDAVAIPELSDFSYAREHWHIFKENNHTRIRYQAEMAPSFFVPPLIGAYIIKSKIRRSLQRTAVRLEELAGSPTPTPQPGSAVRQVEK